MNPDLFPATRVVGIFIFALLMLLAIRVSFGPPRRWRRHGVPIDPLMPRSREPDQT